MTWSRTPMRSAVLAAIGATAVVACGGSGQPSGQPSATAESTIKPEATMQLTSTAFTSGSTIPAEYTCDGAGRSPPLAWSGAPANAKSFALIAEDPDAPNDTFRHWGAYDISADTHELAADASRNAGFRQTSNDFGKPGYGAACPPKGDAPHHYHFRVLALDVAQLSGSPANVKDLLDATDGHVVGNGELIALYGRK